MNKLGCPAIVKDGDRVYIDEKFCTSCGVCAQICPARAIELRHYADAQIIGAIDRLLGGISVDESVEFEYPEEVGVAPPRWHKGND